MTISSLLFGAGLAALSAFFIWLPFRQGTDRPGRGGERTERQKLLGQRAAIYAAIREIDADVQVGKLEAVDHQLLRRRYLAEGVAVLKALAALQDADPVEVAIEKDVERWKEGSELPAGSAAKGVFCTRCGAPAGRGDQFCGRCGASIRG